MTRPFESWKRRSPSDRDEAHAADLIQKLGDAETLSPQAMHRVAHRLRSPGRRRLSLFSDVRLAAASVALLLLFVVAAWATVGFFDRQTAMLAAPRRPAQQTLAQADVPTAQPEATPPEGQQIAGLRLEEPNLLRDGKVGRHPLLAGELDDDARSGKSGFAQPPSGWTPGAGASPVKALATKESEAVGVAPAMPPSVAPETPLLASNERQRARAADRRAASPAAAAPRASPLASAKTSGLTADAEADSSGESGLAGMTVEKCRSTLAVDAETLARNAGDVERALFRHGVCLVLTGRRDAAVTDLHAYLARFPKGRFARDVRVLLVKSSSQSPAP